MLTLCISLWLQEYIGTEYLWQLRKVLLPSITNFFSAPLLGTLRARITKVWPQSSNTSHGSRRDSSLQKQEWCNISAELKEECLHRGVWKPFGRNEVCAREGERSTDKVTLGWTRRSLDGVRGDRMSSGAWPTEQWGGKFSACFLMPFTTLAERKMEEQELDPEGWDQPTGDSGCTVQSLASVLW